MINTCLCATDNDTKSVMFGLFPPHLGSPTSPKTPLSPDSADTSGLDEDSTLEPARTLFTQTSLVDSVLEEVNDGGDINRSL